MLAANCSNLNPVRGRRENKNAEMVTSRRSHGATQEVGIIYQHSACSAARGFPPKPRLKARRWRQRAAEVGLHPGQGGLGGRGD